MNVLLKITSKYRGKRHFLKRCYCDNTVRVRFAPSPTGHLHLGGLRTALYNYFFARSQNGKFLLRIEDTDRTRFVNGATEKILQDLEWVGIQIDEGPFVGGSFGPYFQSERLEIYRKEVKKLLENSTAYYCFCSERRLELLRKEAIRARQVPKYDNKCRHLTPVQIAEKMTNNQKFCIRFKLENYTEPIKDIVYGDVIHNVSENEGDPIIIKTDGYPTYHFANVVDDHLMQITHVLRGVEWQISTTKHLLLYKAFNWNPPKFGHLPLLVNADGTKLSKRQGDIKISSYKDKGVYPQALVNYVTQVGGGFVHESLAKPKAYTIPELIERFDISKVNAHPSRLNPDLLDEFNRLEIMRKISDAKECEELVREVTDLVTQTYGKKGFVLNLDSNHIKKVLQWASYRLTSLNDLIAGQLSFLWIIPQIKENLNVNQEILNELIAVLDIEQFNKANLQDLLKDFSKQQDLMYGAFMMTLRSLLSGLDEGPGVAEMMEILGKENTLERIRNAINK